MVLVLRLSVDFSVVGGAVGDLALYDTIAAHPDSRCIALLGGKVLVGTVVGTTIYWLHVRGCGMRV